MMPTGSISTRDGTPIKNKEDGERMVALSSGLCDLLDDWIDYVRPDVTDKPGASR